MHFASFPQRYVFFGAGEIASHPSLEWTQLTPLELVDISHQLGENPNVISVTNLDETVILPLVVSFPVKGTIIRVECSPPVAFKLKAKLV